MTGDIKDSQKVRISKEYERGGKFCDLNRFTKTFDDVTTFSVRHWSHADLPSDKKRFPSRPISLPPTPSTPQKLRIFNFSRIFTLKTPKKRLSPNVSEGIFHLESDKGNFRRFRRTLTVYVESWKFFWANAIGASTSY